MWCNQIFSLINENKIQNIIVCDNYEIANQIARMTYGENAIAVDSTLYPVSMGDTYDGNNGFMSKDGIIIQRNFTESENIEKLKADFDKSIITKAESDLDIDERLSKMELGLI